MTPYNHQANPGYLQCHGVDDIYFFDVCVFKLHQIYWWWVEFFGFLYIYVGSILKLKLALYN